MRNLEAIEKDLAAARETLSSVEGTPAEVYSRIVGYYRSVRNWNKGKREEYGERRLYRLTNGIAIGVANSNAVGDEDGPGAVVSSPSFSNSKPFSNSTNLKGSSKEMILLLFVRAACPRCPPAKAAATRLGIPVETVNVDTNEGMAEARKRGVLSTPTAILVSPGGEELGRALDAEAIGRLLETEDSICAEPVAV
jgi:ribonucleoside-triphosphate reductase